MSHALGIVRFNDGAIMFYDYDGSCDIVISHLYDTAQEMCDRSHHHQRMSCECGREEKVEIYSHYGDGFYWTGRACRNCKSVEGGDTEEIMMNSTRGQPDWYRSVPREKKWVKETPGDERFAILAADWKRYRPHSSRMQDLAKVPAYQAIIEMGERAVPLILRELAREVDHWFWALHEITGENPVREEHRGILSEMAADWIEWGRERSMP